MTARLSHLARLESEAIHILREAVAEARRPEKWLRNFGRWDKWIVCLTAGTVVPANQEHS